jgi:hypothetical protein
MAARRPEGDVRAALVGLKVGPKPVAASTKLAAAIRLAEHLAPRGALLGSVIHRFADAPDWAHGLGILIWSRRAWVADRQHFDNFYAPGCVHSH